MVVFVRNKCAVGVALLLTACVVFGQSPAPTSSSGNLPSAVAHAAKQHQSLRYILQYISGGWNQLTRSLSSCQTYTDVKSAEPPVLYFPADYPIPAPLQSLEKNCQVRIAHLPSVIVKPGMIDVSAIHPQGLLYLENPYVVPGGRFNEMYGWDSYFIILGLLRDGELDLARGMVENFFFEIQHYGMVLNANRTYYLTRSQPPFLTSMIMAIFNAERAKGREDLPWLAKAYPFAVKDYNFWNRAPHLAGMTGLSRYYDFGQGPAPEVLAGTEPYYRDVASYFVSHPQIGNAYLTQSRSGALVEGAPGPQYSVYVCDSHATSVSHRNCDSVERLGLNRAFYKGDRSMRESGFDVSFRFGPFGADTPDYAPVCLNSLLYKAEQDLGKISILLGRKQEAHEWEQRAALRRERINKLLWNEKRGLYFDYDFAKERQSNYEFATTFYPLWAGVATPEQAKAVERNLRLFEQPGGLVTSRRQTMAQWDYPYGWAPLQLIAVEGLRRYGFQEDADRIAYKFLGTVLQNFLRDGTIREKYNVVTRSSESHVQIGYRQNVVGFGWTNGVFVVLLHELPRTLVSRLSAMEASVASPCCRHKRTGQNGSLFHWR